MWSWWSGISGGANLVLSLSLSLSFSLIVIDMGFVSSLWYLISIFLDCGFVLFRFVFFGFINFDLSSLGFDFTVFICVVVLQTWNHPTTLTPSTNDPSHWIQFEYLVGRWSIFRSPDPTGSSAGQPQTLSNLTHR